MKVMVRVYFHSQILEKKLEAGTGVTVGSGKKDAIQLDAAAFGTCAFQIKTTEYNWSVRSKQLQQMLPFGNTIVLDAEKHLAVTVYICADTAAACISLSGMDKISVGRSDTCDIVVADRQISGVHLEMTKSAGAWRFQDLRSRNGTYFNGTLCREAAVSAGDVLQFGLCKLTLDADCLYVWTQSPVKINVQTTQQPRMMSCADDPYPYKFKPAPRLIEEAPEETVELQSPPDIGKKPVISWLNVLLGPALSVAVMLVVCLLITNVRTMLYFSLPMTCIGAVLSVVRYRGEKKKYQKLQSLRIEKYGAYLQEQIEHLNELASAQRRAMEQMNPPTEACVRMAARVECTIWDRTRRDSEFLSLRIGCGKIPASFSVHAPKRTLSLEIDTLAEQPAQIVERFSAVDRCPISIPLAEHLSCGLIGNHAKCVAEGKNLIIQAATHHSYDDLRIVVLCDQSETEEWRFCRWLPHCYDETRTSRLIADTAVQADKLLTRLLDTVFSARVTHAEAEHYGMRTYPKPFYLFVCATPDLIVQHPMMKYLAANDHRLGTAALYLFDRIAELPSSCHDILEMGSTENHMFERRHASKKQSFVPDAVQPDAYERFARSMAPLRIETSERAAVLPKTVSFLQGYHAAAPAEFPIEQNWGQPYPEQSMAVPIGVRAGGEPFFFDIHEKKHGPHGLVAGMTGSGKSEMVQSWILSMAIRFPPDAVSFVLVDFKGTGLLLPFKGLPHLAGSISDLDSNIGRNLIALENELTRRKALLDQYHVSNISAYLRLLRDGKTCEPLPYLFIIIDEFSEFKNQFPEFIQVVNRVFAIGRTLGIHMILLTQKPGSVVDEKMSANTRFRWCLKVATSSDSREMLHHTDAARIMNPGRAYVQVGEDEVYEEIQSYWSGAPYHPYRRASQQWEEKVSLIDLYGNRISNESGETIGYRSDQREIDVIVKFLDEFCRKNEIKKARQLWTAKLPEQLKLKDLLQTSFDGWQWKQEERSLKTIIGLLDNPASQMQYPLYLDLSAQGNCVVFGAPGTGKTTLLQTAILSFALNYSPEQLNLYLMDFGGGSLNLFQSFPQVGGVVAGDNAEKMEKLANMLLKELEHRKQLISEHGLVNILSYQEATGKKLPYIVLMLDNFAPVLELYPGYDTFFQTIVRDGSSCGIYFIVTAGAQNAISFRISQHMKSALCFSMTDKADYAPIVGRTNGLEPENVPGRGLQRGTPPLEFQVALPGSDGGELARVAQIKQLGKKMRAAWTGPLPPAIPVMPELVRWEAYETEEILCGLNVQTIQPCCIDMRKRQFLLVSNVDGCADTAGVIADQIIQKLRPSLVVDFEGANGNGQKHSAEQFDTAIAAMMPVLQKRKEAFSGEKLDDRQWPYLFVCIRDLKACVETVSDQTLRRMQSILNLGKGLNVLLLAVGKASDITWLANAGESLTMQLVQQTAILVGGSAQSHLAVKTDLPYSAVILPLGEAEGYFIQDGHATRIKAVQQ